ncbi:MAG: sulfite exporter TauE/SafE family protein [Candidatus Taylorbacteria bacterium]|nr:sulfite exporter TauE/SafE family protein [Candidatus Taylorbacteria bacterium]
MTKKYTFHLSGMHCNACVLLTENVTSELPGIISAKSNLSDQSIEIEGDFGSKTDEEVAAELTAVLKPHGYTVPANSTSANNSTNTSDGVTNSARNKWSEFKIAIPIALGFAILFMLLQKLGIVNWVDATEISYGTAFIIGIVASLSSCMAVVGGLLLSMSATFAKENDKVKPQIMFHAGRLVSFFVLGGVIGAIGSAFTLSATATFVLSILIGLVMLILGINLLDVFHWTKKLQPSMPKFLGKHAFGIAKLNHTLTPLIVGIATFFLPCGFTQSMQLYTLSTGSFLAGALTMFSFALGTLPILALVSFSSFSIRNSSRSGIFFKTAGLIVIMFALFNIFNIINI